MRGFGWNFYGFFLFAIAWIVLYFAWALREARRERLRPARGAGGEPGVAGPPSASERGWGPASSKESKPGAGGRRPGVQ